MVLVGIDQDDQVTVADVASRERSGYTYKLKDIIAQSKEASSGGPFWEIYKKETPKKKKKVVKKVYSQEYLETYAEIKDILLHKIPLTVPLKAGTLENEETFVTLEAIDSQDRVQVIDANDQVKTNVKLETVVEEFNHQAVSGSLWNTVYIDLNQANK